MFNIHKIYFIYVFESKASHLIILYILGYVLYKYDDYNDDGFTNSLFTYYVFRDKT